MSTVGSNVIKNVYVGSSKIAKAYLGSSLVYDASDVIIGGRAYKTVIDPDTGYRWMTQNLDWKFSGLNVVTSWNKNSGYYAMYPNGSSDYSLGGKYKFGLMYNTAAIKQVLSLLSTLAPGWRLPTSSELRTCCSSGNYTKAFMPLNSITNNFPSGFTSTCTNSKGTCFIGGGLAGSGSSGSGLSKNDVGNDLSVCYPYCTSTTIPQSGVSGRYMVHMNYNNATYTTISYFWMPIRLINRS